MTKRKLKHTKPMKDDSDYQRLWRIVDGAVIDAIKMHPNYMNERLQHAARTSIVKRVTGAVLGSWKQEGA